MNGKFNKPITVTTNDPEHQTVTLHCKGQILEAIKLSPQNVNFGRVSRQSKDMSRKVRITRGDDGPLKPELMNSGNDNIQAKLKEIEPGERYELDVTVVPPFTSPRLSSVLKLKTGVAKAPTADVRVYGSVVPRAMARPIRITVPPNLKSEMVQSITLNWDNNKPGNITGAKVNDDRITATVDTSDNPQRVIVKVPPGFDHPTGQTKLTIQTDDPDAPEVDVPFSFVRRYRRAPRNATRNPTRVRRLHNVPTPEKPASAQQPPKAEPSGATATTQPATGARPTGSH